MSIESPAPLEEDFSNLPAIPEITFEDCADPKSRKLSTYLADWKLGALDADEKAKRRNANGRIRQEALAYTNLIQRFAQEFQRTGVSAKEFAKANPVELPAAGKTEARKKFLKPGAFSRRLKIFLEHHGVKSIADVDASVPTPPILELADDRYVNPGAPFTMTDGATIMALAGITWFPSYGYRKLHNALKKTMKEPDFIFRDAWKCPTSRQIRTFLEHVPVAMRLYLARGHKKMYAKFGFAQMRDYGDFNFWWAGDAFCMRDVWFRDPDRPEGEQTFQPWVSFAIECSSRYCVSHIVHQEAPNLLHGLRLVREGILPSDNPDFIKIAHGIPVHLQTDNRPPLGGKLVEDICGRLGIKYSPIDPYMSAMNAIAESAVRTLKNYIRTAIAVRMKDRFGKMHRGRALTLSQWPIFVQIVREVILCDYHFSPHAALGQENPNDACMRLMAANPPADVDKDRVIRLTSFEGSAQMQKRGILVDGKWYFNEEKFKGFEGRWVEWVIDPLNPEKGVEIIYQGERICYAPLHVPLGDYELRRSLKGSAPKTLNVMKRTRDTLIETIGVINGASPSRVESRRRPIPKGSPNFSVPKSLGQLPDLFSEPNTGNES